MRIELQKFKALASEGTSSYNGGNESSPKSFLHNAIETFGDSGN